MVSALKAGVDAGDARHDGDQDDDDAAVQGEAQEEVDGTNYKTL